MKQKLFTRNFTLLVLGQAGSLFGNYILRLALSMYVLEVTGSAAVFAAILSAAAVPMILLSPLGGVLADRADRRNVMVALDALTGCAVLCAAFFLSREHAALVTGVLLVVLSVFGAFETPTVQACIPQMLSGDAIIKGNAVVNQVASISFLTAPVLGGMFYAAFGLKPVMYASVGCFFLTAFLECFIEPGGRTRAEHGNFGDMVKEDLLKSIQFLTKERPDIMKLLMLAAGARFFVMGTILVGFPYMIRTVLGLEAQYYGAAESMLAAAVIAGSIAAGALTERLHSDRLSLVLAFMGICLLPAGAVFLLPVHTMAKYVVNVAAFCGLQAAISIFSIFAVSMIQQNTPAHLIGKVMAYTSTVTMCAQPAGQMVYGFLFDGFRENVWMVLLPTGAVVCAVGLWSGGFFRRMQGERSSL